MSYLLRESTRSRHLRITIEPDGAVILTKPVRTSLEKALVYLQKHSAWIQKVQKKLEDRAKRSEKLHGPSVQLPRLRRNTAAYKAALTEAKELVTDRIQHFEGLEDFTYKLISIRNQKARWGSCSAQGTLSFNYRLIYLTTEELDYLIVHELAHTKHHNHGKDFWAEVERFIPEYKKLRNSMRRYRW